MTRLRPPSPETLFVATFGLLGIRLGARPIADNSMLTHLRTGIDMVADGTIPRTDPYTWSGRGERWVVQSWLADALYGLAEAGGGLRLVVVVQAVLFGLVALLVAHLARAGTALRTAAAATIAMAVGLRWWSPRPLMIGLLCLALVVLVVDRRHPPIWLVPVMWVWGNTHGTWPLGLVWLALVAVGAGLDRRRAPEHLVRYGAAAAGGILLAALNPLGPRLLAVPLEVLAEAESFALIAEWGSPSFRPPAAFAALAALVAAVVVLARTRPPWADVLPAAAFVGLALLAQRNLPAAGVVLAPVLGRALAPSRPAVAAPGRPVDGVFGAVLVAAAVVFVAGVWRQPALDLERYPVAAVAWMDRAGLWGSGSRVVHDDATGNYAVLRFGKQAVAFTDDRYLAGTAPDVVALKRGGREALAVLERRDADVVLWRDGEALSELLRRDGWDVLHTSGDWVVLHRPEGE